MPDANLWLTQAQRLASAGRPDAAMASARRCLAAEPDSVAAQLTLADAHLQKGQEEAAVGLLRRALSRNPAEALRARLDGLTHPAGAPSELTEIRDRARSLQLAGRWREALALHREALKIAPQLAGIWLSAGMLADALGEQWSSLTFFEEAARLNPVLLPALESARRIACAAGLTDKATRYATSAYALAPSDDIQIAQALLLPAILPSCQALDATRSAYAAALNTAMTAGFKVREVAAALHMGQYFLAYHGKNDTELQRTAARFIGAVLDAPLTAPHCGRVRRPGRIRIGFVSRFFFSHSIGATSRGLIGKLSREHFEVLVLRIMPTKRDATTEEILASADRAVDLDADHRAAAAQIAALELDILFFQDIGMELTSYLLALSRLAPVQCVSFGHPNTTGLPNMDYFISNDLYELPGAEAHYTEELFVLNDLPTLAYYYPPAVAARAEREEFGLAAEDHVYLCPQALAKIHPEFDPILADILSRDPEGILVMIGGGYPDQAEELLRRMGRTLGGAMRRVLMLDGMAFPRFMQLIACADVCLDTLHFNGMNSSLEALASGVPIVTLPSGMQRGRHTQAMYRKMGILELIAGDAAEYAALAVRLATDPVFSRNLRERIRRASHVLFEDQRVVQEFERFFLTAFERANRSAAG